MPFKNNILVFFTIFTSFLLDRVSKFFLIDFFLKNNLESYYVSPNINFILIWNKGVAFGLLNSDNVVYHFISVIILFIICFLIFLLIKSRFLFEKICYSLIIGGALGNFFDRLYYGQVPDFIDCHFKDVHWFTFNVADIWITVGIFALLFFDIFKYKNKNNDI